MANSCQESNLLRSRLFECWDFIICSLRFFPDWGSQQRAAGVRAKNHGCKKALIVQICCCVGKLLSLEPVYHGALPFQRKTLVILLLGLRSKMFCFVHSTTTWLCHDRLLPLTLAKTTAPELENERMRTNLQERGSFLPISCLQMSWNVASNTTGFYQLNY